MITDIVITGITQGMAIAMVAIAVMLPLKILSFPDLSAEGAYPLGGAVCAACLTMGMHPAFAMLLGVLSGSCVSVVTGLINLRLHINSLLAGVITSMMCYSLVLRILGKPNVHLFNLDTYFQWGYGNILALISIVSCILLSLILFLKTDFGLRFRAIGFNTGVAKKYGINIDKYTILGLGAAGCCSGLAGSIIVQMQGYVDVGMGTGIAVSGLAALIIGEVIVGTNTAARQVLAAIVGSLVYPQIQGLALSCGLAPSDLKFFTSLMVLATVFLRKNYGANNRH